MNAPVDYWPDFVTDPDEAFQILMTELPWKRHDLPRDETYYNDSPVPYTYGDPRYARTYMPEPEWHPLILAIRADLESRLATTLDVCFLNRYLNARDQLGWHADDSPEMDPARPIVTVSLGAERDIQFRHMKCWHQESDPKLCPVCREIETLTLGHGSAAIMRPGMQQEWQHRIPKSSRSNIGPRISLTFRGYVAKL